jgi:hypothetical protein
MWEPDASQLYGPPQPVTGIALSFTLPVLVIHVLQIPNAWLCEKRKKNYGIVKNLHPLL